MERAITILQSAFVGGESVEMDSFPENVPLTPAVGFDMRFGIMGKLLRPRHMAADIGASVMYFNSAWVNWNWNMFDFTIFTLGGDARFSLFLNSFGITLGGGYFYTTNKYVFEPLGSQATFNFLTDTGFVSLQMDYEMPTGILTPFIGFKGVFSGTNVDYSWHTSQNISFGGKTVGNNYTYSAVRQDKMFLYPQIYGGFGVLGNIVTLGASYDFAAKNFGAHASVRLASGHTW
jgi:hypothetical protein